MLERLSDPEFWTLLIGFAALGVAGAVAALDRIAHAERQVDRGFQVRTRR